MAVRDIENLVRSANPVETKRILILCAGFGGIYAALGTLVRRRDLEVTLTTRDNYFLFTPMLAEVAAGELELSTEPSRQAYAQVERELGVEPSQLCLIACHT